MIENQQEKNQNLKGLLIEKSDTNYEISMLNMFKETFKAEKYR